MANLLQLRNGTIQEWAEANPILAEGEPGVSLEPSGGIVIGDGKRAFKDLPYRLFGQDAYDILVMFGGYKGTKEDFCRQLDVHLKTPEQQVGTLTNAGPGWNSFTFMKEFSEDVYVLLTPQAATVFASVRNITKQGFHYCLYDADGNTVSENVVVNFLAVAVSELNMAQAIAQAAGLNPFDFDNLTSLFTDHAAEVVTNEAAFNLTKRSAMAAGRYICHLTGLNPDTYHNMISIAGNELAMNTVAKSEETIAFIQEAPGAYDSIRLGTMSIAKYLIGILKQEPEEFNTIESVLNDEAVSALLVASGPAMVALCGSLLASTAMVEKEGLMPSMSASEPAMAAISASSIAMGVITEDLPAMRAVMAELVGRNNYFGSAYVVGKGLALYASLTDAAVIDCNTIAELVESTPAMTAISGNNLAITALATSNTAMSAVTESNKAMTAIVKNAVSIKSVVENAISMNAITNSGSAMTIMAGNNNAMTAVVNNTSAITGVIETSASMTIIAASDVAMTAVARSASVMNLLLGNEDAVRIIIENPVAITAISRVKAGMDVIAGNEEFLAKIIDNRSILTIFAANSVAMTAVAGSEVAMTAVAGSEVAMTAVAGSEVARDTIRKNSSFWKKVTDSNVFIAKFAIGCLNSNTYKPSDFANIAVVASNSGACIALSASQIAMNALSASQIAMNALSASQIAMNALSASQIARDAMKNNSVSWKVVTDSNAFIAKYSIGCLENSNYKPTNFAGMSNIVSNSAALAALASSSTAMSALASSSTAMSALASSSTASKAVVSVISTYRTKVITSVSNTSYFTKKTMTIGSGAGSWDSELNTNTVYIPTICNDDNDTDYKVYSGANTSIEIVSISRHSGNVNITTGVCLRGARVVGTGSSAGNVTFDVYTVK